MKASAADVVLGTITSSAHSSTITHAKSPRAPPTRAWTPPAVRPARLHVSATMPRGRNSTESIAGSARPTNEAGTHTNAWSRSTCCIQPRHSRSAST